MLAMEMLLIVMMLAVEMVVVTVATLQLTSSRLDNPSDSNSQQKVAVLAMEMLLLVCWR